MLSHKELDIFLGAIIYPRHLEPSLNHLKGGLLSQGKKTNIKKVIDKIHNALYKFSLQKVRSLLRIPQMQILYTNYHESQFVHGSRL